MPILIQRFTTSEWKFQFWNNTVLLFLSVFFGYGKDDFFQNFLCFSCHSNSPVSYTWMASYTSNQANSADILLQWGF